MLSRLLFMCVVMSGVIAADRQPDIVIVLADDFGWGEIGGGAMVPTPHLDRIAAAGTQFRQGYVASPICSPSRCGLLTGQQPGRWRITSYLQARKGNADCGQVDFLAVAAPTLPRLLHEAGYATAHVGKWHLGGGRDVTDAPLFAAYGYDLGYGTYESPEPHPDITSGKWIWSKDDPVKRWDRTRWMIDQTLKFMDDQNDKPCFVNLWLDDTHTPWVPTAEDQGDKNRHASSAALVGVVQEMDRQIGRLQQRLTERMAVTKRPVLLFFMGDNGPSPTFERKRTGGLRGSKWSLYEGGVRVPFFDWSPGIVTANRVDEDSVVSTLDILPTCLAFAHVPMPADYVGDGQNIQVALSGGTIVREKPLLYEYGRNAKSFIYPKGEGERSPNLAIRDGQWKLLINDDGTQTELYNLSSDVAEKTNLAEQQADIVTRLRAVVMQWRQRLP